MSLNEIIERFTLVSGWDMQEVSRYLPIIRDCAAYFEDSIGRELTDGERGRVAYACAVYAYYKIASVCRDGGLSFKAGDVQVNMDEICESARRMWESERREIADIVDIGGDFAFRSVKV